MSLLVRKPKDFLSACQAMFGLVNLFLRLFYTNKVKNQPKNSAKKATTVAKTAAIKQNIVKNDHSRIANVFIYSDKPQFSIW
jgi:hypothetical protein